MFGRRVTPGPPPPPPRNPDFPMEPFREALTQLIRRLSQGLTRAGVDCGGLFDGAPVTATLPLTLTDAMRFGTPKGPRFFAFGCTHDFRTIDFTPHLRVFLMTNIAGMMQQFEAIDFSQAETVIRGMAPPVLIDAHLMRAWLAYPLAVSAALQDGPEALKAIARQLRSDIDAVAARMPPELAAAGHLEDRLKTWRSFPAVMTHTWDEENRGLNDLPMTPQLREALVQWLAEQQAQGLRERHGGV